MSEGQSPDEAVPAWGTPPSDPRVPRRERWTGILWLVGSVAVVLLVVGILTVSVAADGQIPLLDAIAGVILLAVGVAMVAAVVVGVRRLVRRGLLSWGPGESACC